MVTPPWSTLLGFNLDALLSDLGSESQQSMPVNLYRVKSTLPILSSEMRLFLFRLHELHRRGTKLAGRRFLAQACDSNDKTVADTLNRLTEKRLLTAQHIYSSKGHKITQYEFTEKINQSLKGKQILKCDMYWEPIKKLCFPNDELKSRKKGGLSRSHRYLMSVLLYHADECGAVYDLTMDSLAKKAGLSIDRLRSQLRFLKNEKYLNKCIVQPVKSRIFQSGAAVIFINMRHSIFAKLTKNGLIKITCETINFVNEVCAGAALYARANGGRSWSYSKTSNPDIEFRGLMGSTHRLSKRFFEGHNYKSTTYKRTRRIGNGKNQSLTMHKVTLNQNLPETFLQAKLDQYASSVLTNCRDELSISNNFDKVFSDADTKALSERIFSDMFPHESLDSANDDLHQSQELVACCVWEAYRMAHFLYRILAKSPISIGPHHKFAIFPPPKVDLSPRLAIEIGVYPSISNQGPRVIELNDDFSL